MLLISRPDYSWNHMVHWYDTKDSKKMAQPINMKINFCFKLFPKSSGTNMRQQTYFPFKFLARSSKTIWQWASGDDNSGTGGCQFFYITQIA